MCWWNIQGLIGVKKWLEDYEQMSYYYIMMKTRNKMQEFDVKFVEQWEVIEEYFTKQLEKNLAQCRVDERILKYKLEIYHKQSPKFVCGSPTSTKTLGQDEEAEIRPNGTTQESKVQTQKSQELRGGGQEKRRP